MRDRRTRQEFSEWIALEAFVVLAVTPLVLAAVFGQFHNARSVVAVLLVATGVIAVVCRRRAAWLVLVLFYGAVLLSYAWDWTGTLLFAVNAAIFVLLVSPPIRRHVAKRRTPALD
jgi:hypothetical protein